MDKKLLSRIVNILYFALIVGVFVFGYLFISWLYSQGGQCVKDPINFYENATNTVCNCYNLSGGLK